MLTLLTQHTLTFPIIFNLLWTSLWFSRLRIRHCYCSCLGHCCGASSIPGPGTFMCHGCGQKKKKKKKRCCDPRNWIHKPLTGHNLKFEKHWLRGTKNHREVLVFLWVSSLRKLFRSWKKWEDRIPPRLAQNYHISWINILWNIKHFQGDDIPTKYTLKKKKKKE